MFTIKANAIEKEAMWSAIIQYVDKSGDHNPQLMPKVLRAQLKSDQESVILTGDQLRAILLGLPEAVKHYQEHGDDWVRAIEYGKARDSIIESARASYALNSSE